MPQRSARAVSTYELVNLPLEKLNVIAGKAQVGGFAMNDKNPRADFLASALSIEMDCALLPFPCLSQQDTHVYE